MNAKPIAQPDVRNKLVSHWEQVCNKIESLADAFPAQKYDLRPAENVRSVGDVLRHVAFWNQYVADRARGKKADDSTNELPKTKYSSKADVMAALKRSADDATKALRTSLPDSEIAEMVLSFVEHNCEHYGQLAVYARLNGIVPPASRG